MIVTIHRDGQHVANLHIDDMHNWAEVCNWAHGKFNKLPILRDDPKWEELQAAMLASLQPEVKAPEPKRRKRKA